MIRMLLICCTAIISAYLLKDGLVQFKSYERLIDVKGVSERVVTSDQAQWTISYSSLGNDLKVTNENYIKTQKILLKFFQDLGFTEQEIQKSPAAITDNWSNTSAEQRPTYKYSIRGQVIVSTAKVDAVAQALDKTDELLQLGITFESSSVIYRFTKLNDIKAEMIKDAIKNAKTTSEQLAENMNETLGAIKSASQGLFSITDTSSDYDSQTTIDKKVRVVVQTSFHLK